MESFTVTIQNEGRRETYEPPQLIGLSIDGEEAVLEFDPIHSDTLSLSCDRTDLISVDIMV